MMILDCLEWYLSLHVHFVVVIQSVRLFVFHVVLPIVFGVGLVLFSLNGIDDVRARLLSKAEYILSSRKRVMWDISVVNIIIIIPWENVHPELHKMVIESEAFSITSKCKVGSFASEIEDQSYVLTNIESSASVSDAYMKFQPQDLYNHFDIKLHDFEMKVMIPNYSKAIPVLEKFSASMMLASCIIPDEPILKRLEVYLIVPSLCAHFSPSIYGAIMGIMENTHVLHSTIDSPIFSMPDSLYTNSSRSEIPKMFWFSVVATIGSAGFLVDIENDEDNSCILMLSLQEFDVRFGQIEFPECWICVKALRILSYSRKDEKDKHVLCSSGNVWEAYSAYPSEADVRLSNESENYDHKIRSAGECFLLHFGSRTNVNLICRKCTVCLSDIEFHCYPYIVGLLVGFSDKISKYGPSHLVEDSPSSAVDCNNPLRKPFFEFQRFGYSKFFQTGTSECANIAVDDFPFVTVYNAGSLFSFGSSLIHAVPEWRTVLNSRDRKMRSDECIVKKESNSLFGPAVKSWFGTDDLPMPEDFDDPGVFIIDLNISSIRLHFHDSSCIVGTITLPNSKCSFTLHEDLFDIICSTEGLVLSSSWWNQTIHDFLWGPSSPSLSPILNICMRKRNVGSLRSLFEICFEVQHVSCILPPEFLAIIIGYFSLPDWSFYTNEQPLSENTGCMDLENNSAVTYKFEILDSTLFTPVESDNFRFLKLDIQQLHISFIHRSDPNTALKDIPTECLVSSHKVARRSNCVDVSGHDVSLSLLLLKDDSSIFDQKTGNVCIDLICPISADVWVRIPSDSESFCVSSVASTCVMVRVNSCQLLAEGGYVFVGYEALLSVINQFSLVEKESQCFTSDVLQFLQSKKSLKENSSYLLEAAGMTFTETKFCVNSMSLKFFRSGEELNASEPVAIANMQFICSASLKDDKPMHWDISFSSLALLSLVNSIMLAECTSSCSTSSVLEMTFKMSDQGENELHVSAPSLDIWLHLFEWSEVIDLLNSYSGQLVKTLSVDAPSEISNLVPVDQNDIVTVNGSQNSPQFLSMSRQFAPETMKHDPVFLIVKSENVGMTVHMPVCVSEGAFSICWESCIQKRSPVNYSSNAIKANHNNFIVVSVESRHSELVWNGKTAKVKFNSEKTSGRLEIYEDKSVHTWPCFQLFHVNMEAEFRCGQKEHGNVKVVAQCDNLDLWLSQHVFCFGQHEWFKIPAAGSSQVTFGSMEFEIQLRKISLLVTGGRWISNGPLLEILIRNLLLVASISERKMEGSVAGDLQVSYNNIHKVLWEPFIEPWNFQLGITRKHDKSALLSNAIMTDIHLKSTTQLNMNFTESFMEVVFRAVEMIKDAWGLMGLNDLSENPKFLNSQSGDNVHTGHFAPYILQNLTSLPLVFYICQGLVSVDDLDAAALKDKKCLQPGSSIPIYIEESAEQQLFHGRPANSSDKLSDKQLTGVAHHYIIIQLEGTCMPSAPISMDLVGLHCFEVNFSKTSNNLEVGNIEDALKANKNVEVNNGADTNGGFVVPVVVDVSVQRYSKLMRLYSTVILLNATSVPLEVRFDIPFGVSPKILDPIYPGQEFPLPLHLAEAGCMRCRPLDDSCLWSEAYNISNILSHESRIGFLRSFVSYPSHPSCDPFRFCISAQDMCLTSIGRQKRGSGLYLNSTIKQSVERSGQVLHNLDKSQKRYIHLVSFTTPFVVKSYLPEAVSLTVESRGVTRTALLKEVEISFFHVDSSHDLEISFSMRGYKSSTLKFPRAETFAAMAKFSGTKFSLSETVAFDSDIGFGPIYVTMDKAMDAFSGAREICLFVPFLLYNCSGFSLVVSNAACEMKGCGCTVPSCYDLDEQDLVRGRKDGLGLLIASHDLQTAPHKNNLRDSSLASYIVSTRKNIISHCSEYSSKPFFLSGSSTIPHRHMDKHDLRAPNLSLSDLKSDSTSSSQLNLQFRDFDDDYKKVNACMYSPSPNSSASEIMVKVSRCLSECVMDNIPTCSWSMPFFLVPPTGSTSVLVPQPFTNAAYIISVTSSALDKPFSGRTRITTFQPRYVISNACSKDVCYKQKGTDCIFHLGIGQHSHLHWTDTTSASWARDATSSTPPRCLRQRGMERGRRVVTNFINLVLNLMFRNSSRGSLPLKPPVEAKPTEPTSDEDPTEDFACITELVRLKHAAKKRNRLIRVRDLGPRIVKKGKKMKKALRSNSLAVEKCGCHESKSRKVTGKMLCFKLT
ncbi:unnamed protein product [Ilex paraguariensis]|uniref:Vacuolar protein sorting-associated protein 13 VPS13 adaptor binding domain-containing protein n=1 Tax=Ilex paraguariensis TaxID=185542 RepID=A0ABC8UN56_9AQUA